MKEYPMSGDLRSAMYLQREVNDIHEAVMNPMEVKVLPTDTFTLKAVKELIIRAVQKPVSETVALKEAREIGGKYEDRYFASDAIAHDLKMTLHALLDRDITFDGPNAVLPFESHDQAINHITEARRKGRP
jgi:hypothetical protein